MGKGILMPAGDCAPQSPYLQRILHGPITHPTTWCSACMYYTHPITQCLCLHQFECITPNLLSFALFWANQ